MQIEIAGETYTSQTDAVAAATVVVHANRKYGHYSPETVQQAESYLIDNGYDVPEATDDCAWAYKKVLEVHHEKYARIWGGKDHARA